MTEETWLEYNLRKAGEDLERINKLGKTIGEGRLLGIYLNLIASNINTLCDEYHAYVSLAGIMPNLIIHEKVRSFERE